MPKKPVESVQNPTLNVTDASGSDSRSLLATNNLSLPPVCTVPLSKWWSSFSRWLVGVGMKAMTLICNATESRLSHLELLIGVCLWNHSKFSHHSPKAPSPFNSQTISNNKNKTIADSRYVEKKLWLCFYFLSFYLFAACGAALPLVPRGGLHRKQPLHQKVRHFCHPSTARCHGNDSRLCCLYM